MKARKLTTYAALTVARSAEWICGNQRSIDSDDRVLRPELSYHGCYASMRVLINESKKSRIVLSTPRDRDA